MWKIASMSSNWKLQFAVKCKGLNLFFMNWKLALIQTGMFSSRHIKKSIQRRDTRVIKGGRTGHKVATTFKFIEKCTEWNVLLLLFQTTLLGCLEPKILDIEQQAESTSTLKQRAWMDDYQFIFHGKKSGHNHQKDAK